MTYWRTSRQHVGGNHAGGSPHGSKYALPENSILASGSSLELSEIGEPSLDEREFGACSFSAIVILSPVIIVGGLVLGYLALVPQSIQY